MIFLKRWLRDWLGISDIEKHQTATEEVINHLVTHLTEARDNIDKLAEITLAQSRSPEIIEAPAAKPAPKKVKKDGK